MNAGAIKVIGFACLFFGFILGELDIKANLTWIAVTGLACVTLTLLFAWYSKHTGENKPVNYVVVAVLCTVIGIAFGLFW